MSAKLHFQKFVFCLSTSSVKWFLLLGVVFLHPIVCKSQNNIQTFSPMLKIAPDAVSSALGEVGVGTRADTYAQYWNAAKYAFADQNTGFGLSYLPYILSDFPNVNLLYLSGYHKMDERNTLGFGFRYFALGSLDKGTSTVPSQATIRPNEFALDASYAIKLGHHVSISLTARFLSSSLRSSQNSSLSAINSALFDIGAFYQSNPTIKGIWRGGFSISNVGAKIRQESFGKEEFMPTTLRLGGSRDFFLTGDHRLSLNLEFAKLLVPSPPKYGQKDTDGDGIPERVIVAGRDDNVSFFDGLFQSFYDAPGGFTEELSEITVGSGLEYAYLDTIAFRVGHFYEDPNKGYRKYVTIGGGFKYRYVAIDLSYLFSTSTIVNPMGNSLKLSLRVDLVRQKS